MTTALIQLSSSTCILSAGQNTAGRLSQKTERPLCQRQPAKARKEITCNAGRGQESYQTGRREALLGIGAATIGANLLTLHPAEAADVKQRIQRSKYFVYVRDKFRAFLDENNDDIPLILNLAFRDAATYDPDTRIGGANGSILFDEELNRPDNQYLKPIARKLEKVNAEIAAETPNGPLGKADLVYVAGEVAMKRAFLNDAIKKARGNREKGIEVNHAFSTESMWSQFEKRLGRTDALGPDNLGRTDATSPSPNLKLPTKDSPVAEIKDAFQRIGFKPRDTVVMASLLGHPDEMLEKYRSDPELEPFVKKYQSSRREVSQTSYEVDLINAFTKLAFLGQKEPNTLAYTIEPKQRLKV